MNISYDYSSSRRFNAVDSKRSEENMKKAISNVGNVTLEKEYIVLDLFVRMCDGYLNHSISFAS